MECTFIKAEKERGMRKMKPQKQLLQLVMLALLSVVSVLVTSNESFAALQCSSCHGNNADAHDALPLDTPPGSPASYRNITTGAVKGNHQTHLNGLNITDDKPEHVCPLPQQQRLHIQPPQRYDHPEQGHQRLAGSHELRRRRHERWRHVPVQEPDLGADPRYLFERQLSL